MIRPSRRTSIWLCLILLIVFSSSAYAEEGTIRKLSLDEATQLALQSFSEMKQTKWELAASEAEMSYVQSEKNKLASANVETKAPLLTVNADDYFAEIKDWDDLEEEEQNAILQSINLQIAINRSINQWIQYQNGIQNAANQQEKNQQLETYDARLRELNCNQSLASLAVMKAEPLIRYKVKLQYIGLKMASSEMEFVQESFEDSQKLASDAAVLYKAGRLSRSGLEKIQRQARAKQGELESKRNSYQIQLSQFKRGLGMNADLPLELDNLIIANPSSPDLKIAVDLDRNYDIKQMDAKIKLAKSNLDAAGKGTTEMKNYYTVLWSQAVEQRNTLRVELGSAVEAYQAEAATLYYQFQNASSEAEDASEEAQDAYRLYVSKRISFAKLEQANQSQREAEYKLDQFRYQYLLQTERMKLAAEGVIISEK
ncbi:TolC family protein [Paenibacillus glufosinatiresistens]|uniref:hypothetical protein n=1 Tax=Paenibacillus glufosinatiresistens TaxID=3070657 RepID=UPI00286DFB0F|nr:hypothetical protein [Paenibacillus sp. YX.27]